MGEQVALSSIRKVVRPQGAKKLLAGHAKNTVSHKAIAATVEQVALALGIIFGEVSQRTEGAGIGSCGVLHLDSVDPRFAVYHEVDLVPRSRLPVMHCVLATRVVAPGAQMLCDQTFQGESVDFGG